MNNKITIKQVCPKCGKEFELTISQALYNKGQYRKYCSRSCANSRQFTDESRKKKSDSIKAYYSHKNNDLTYYGNELAIYECKNCGKKFTTDNKLLVRCEKCHEAHKNKVAPTYTRVCPVCGKIRPDENTYKCPLCCSKLYDEKTSGLYEMSKERLERYGAKK